MSNNEELRKNVKYFELLSNSYPNITSAVEEVVNLKAILNLPKATEHFLTDIHGEYEAFNHVMQNASGAVRRKVYEELGSTVSIDDLEELTTLIYYPRQKLEMINSKKRRKMNNWYELTIYRLIKVARASASKYTRSKVRKMLPKNFAYIMEELLQEDEHRFNKKEYYTQIIKSIVEYNQAEVFIVEISEVIKKLRDKRNHTSVLMLTARDSADDKVKGLDLGADDYIVKPFDFNELLARIRAVVRRKYGNSSNKLVIGDLILDTSEKSVTRAGKQIELTGKEYEVLEYLMQSKNRILSRDQIKEHVWDFDYEGDSNIIDVLIKNIRKKIDIEDGKQIIYTKRGLGYVIKED